MEQAISARFLGKMKKLKTAQAVNLAIWAGLNILVAGIFLFHSEAHYFYFHAMNASWNLVNLFVAAFIYHHHNEIFKKRLSILKQMDYQRHIEKAILFNLGFDVSFVATGFAMYFYGQIPLVSHPELWLGFGISIIFQGTFLLIQDMFFYGFHLNNRYRIYLYWEKMLEKIY